MEKMTKEELDEKIEMCQPGKARMELLKKGWELADAEGDYDLQIRYRMEYIDDSNFHEDILDMYIIFPEVIRLHDKRVKEYGQDPYTKSILWNYKWVIEDAEQFYQISEEQFENFCADFKRRCIQNGYSLRTLHQYRMSRFVLYDKERAKKEYAAYKKCKRDALSDCLACERSAEVYYLLEAGEEEEALKMAAPLFAEEMTCGEQPEVTFGNFLRYYNQKIIEGNTEYAKEAEEMCAGVLYGIHMYDVGNEFRPDILMYFTLTEPEKALRFYKQNWRFFEENRNPYTRFYFAAAASRFFAGIGKEKYKMAMEPSYIFYKEDDTYDVEKIRLYYENIALDIARKLDSRNGANTFEERYYALTKR